MAKYEPLRDHILKSAAARIVMTFREIEQVIGSPSPDRARGRVTFVRDR
jgi:hypothetical protein